MALKKLLFIFALVLSAMQVLAQDRPMFNPERFEADMEQFIVTEAGLSPQEAAAFFPVYKEMQGKQRFLFNKMRRYRHMDTSDDKVSLDAIKNMDAIDVQIKKLQQQYHLKFCKVLPAGKVLRVLKAEEKFHRQAFRRMVKHRSKE